jgi:hypothetical protein
MNKQTAVEWLQEAMSKKLSSEIGPYFLDLFEQAKAIEKEQIEAAYRAGYTDCSLDRFSDCEQYYTSNYE